MTAHRASICTEELGIRGYGKVLFTRQPYAPNHLYVIGQRHDNPLKEKEYDYLTVHTQTDIYRISEKLYKEQDVQLLLVEGASRDHEALDSFRNHRRDSDDFEETRRSFREADDDYIATFLGLNPLTTSSAPLLATVYDVGIHGFDEMDLVHSVIHFLGLKEGSIRKEEFEECIQSAPEAFKVVCIYLTAHLNKLRTGKALINSLEITEREYENGHIPNRKAMAQIGHGHVDDMIDFVKRDRVRVKLDRRLKEHVPGLADVPEIDVKLNLVDRGYGVTFIKPVHIEGTAGDRYAMNAISAVFDKMLSSSSDKVQTGRAE